jgi:ABC-type uncharacterized transport system involved in gliding motility auxiliary subunit
MPTVLVMTRAGIAEDDIVTSQIDNIVFPFGGAFTGKAADGLKQTVLLKTSPNSQLVDGMLSSVGGENIVKDFKPSNLSYALAVRLTGKFKTAFPDGKPKAKKDEKEDKDAKKTEDTEKPLKESTKDGAVILVADSDLINDQVCVQIQDLMGYKIVQPLNGNLNMVQSMVEQLAGDSGLISLRSRASLNRPFTRVKEMEAKAQAQYQSKIKELEESLTETQRKINDYQSKKQGNQRFILSPEQQQEVANFRKKEVEVKKELKDLRKNLRKDTDSLEFWTKVLNIGIMPALVTVTGVGLAMVKRKKTAAK